MNSAPSSSAVGSRRRWLVLWLLLLITIINFIDRQTVSVLAPIIRALACFCLWGGCFIVATAIAVQVLGLHGDLLALALVTVAAIATWLLLPKQSAAGSEDQSSVKQ